MQGAYPAVPHDSWSIYGGGPFPSIQQSSTSRLPVHCKSNGSDALYLVGSAHQQTDLSNSFDICCLGLQGRALCALGYISAGLNATAILYPELDSGTGISAVIGGGVGNCIMGSKACVTL